MTMGTASYDDAKGELSTGFLVPKPACYDDKKASYDDNVRELMFGFWPSM